jgi:4-diphosphocytidyl-2-C-methyl-D-erythritol kinase
MSVLRNCLAPAKLNLFLHVVGRRPDGYHELQSVMQLIDWCDILHFQTNKNGVVRRLTDLSYAAEDDDIVVKAARKLQKLSGVSDGVDIEIEKNIPWGAGLGGGSSDAATTLFALNRLWGLNFSLSQLQEIGVTLGADVPFFLSGKNAWVEGIGEILTPICLPSKQFLICYPSEVINTVKIFTDPDLTRDSKKTTIADFLESYCSSSEVYKNDLQPVAQKGSARLSEALIWMGQFGYPRMTGSGSSVFVEVDGKKNIQVDSQSFGLIKLVSSLSQHPFVC